MRSLPNNAALQILGRIIMKIGNFSVKIFKIRNRRGYAALCNDCLTEAATERQAYDRMVKAIRRVTKKAKK